MHTHNQQYQKCNKNSSVEEARTNLVVYSAGARPLRVRAAQTQRQCSPKPAVAFRQQSRGRRPASRALAPRLAPRRGLGRLSAGEARPPPRGEAGRPEGVGPHVEEEGEDEDARRVDEAGGDVAREEDVQSVVDGLGEEVAARAVGRRVRRHVVPNQPDGGAAVCEDPEVRQQAVVEVEHLERLQRAQHAVQPKHGDDQVPDAHARREQRASRHVDEERHRRRRPRPERVVSVEDGAQPEAQLHEGEEAVHRHHRRCVRPRLCRRPRRGGHLAVRAADDGPLDEVRLHPREGGEEEQGDRERPVERVLNKVVLRLVVVWKLGEPRKALLDERDRVLECTDGDRRADDEDRVELEVGERHSLY
mmetsp:Transcript_14472/g.42667  ORF Transcript_14472/g.42667 Transcript_14472/m.42667 type:complete len:362 (-) Transcript_14472:71-1156(-)